MGGGLSDQGHSRLTALFFHPSVIILVKVKLVKLRFSAPSAGIAEIE